MSASRIQSELAAVAARIAKLSGALEKERTWEAELQTSLRVLQRLGDGSASSQADVIVTVQGAFAPPRGSGRVRSDVVKRAEDALVAMLQEAKAPIKQMDAVRRLREEHGIVVGNAVPGRETSDLSAALGAGKSPYLTVDRRDGWTLTEWSDASPPTALLNNHNDDQTPAVDDPLNEIVSEQSDEPGPA